MLPPEARPLARRLVGWALLADAIPLYPLYALLFVDSGLSEGEVSLLFAIWSGVAIVAEVPSGALADRFTRRAALVASGLLQAAAYVAWTTSPGFAGFAVGFVLWGLGGSLVSGALEALLYDGLAASGAAAHYPHVLGWVTGAGLAAQLPAVAAATVLHHVGGYPLVAWASVGCCLAAAGVAAGLPEAARDRGAEDAVEGWVDTLRAGVAEAARTPTVRPAVLAVAAVGGLDALEEYLPLVVRDQGVPTGLNPAVLLGVTLAAAAGAALAGAAAGLRPRALAVVLGVAAVALGLAAGRSDVAGVVLVALFYVLYRPVAVVVEARLQDRVGDRSRATVTSVATFGTEVATFGVYAAWAVGGLTAVAVLVAATAAWLPRVLRTRPRQPSTA